MNHFETKVVAKRMAEFARLNAKLLPVGDWRGDFKRTLDRAVLAAEQNGLSDSATRLKEIIKESGHGRLNEHSVAAYANSAESVIRNELAKRKFLVVSPELSNYLDKDRLFGDKVWHGFPSARADIREAGNCLATGCNTAAVFHLMRAVEWGLRALATDLGVRRLRGVRRSGRATLTPVAYSQWETILNSLPGRVASKLKRLRPGPTKHKRERFYEEAIEEIRGIKGAWRNHVMHARDLYGAEDALAIFGHVKRLMVNLSSRISEV